MFDNNRKEEIRASLSLAEIKMVQEAIDKSVDCLMSSLDIEEKVTVAQMLIDFATRYKLIYLLSPSHIREVINSYMSHDPHRSAMEDLTSRFIANLDDADAVIPRLTYTLAKAVSSFNRSQLLPRGVVDETVSFEDALKVFAGESWLLFIGSVSAYYNAYMLDDMIDRNKAKMSNG